MKKIGYELFLLSSRDLNGNGKIELEEMRRVPKNAGINLSESALSAGLSTPNPDSPVKFSSWGPDGGKLGETVVPNSRRVVVCIGALIPEEPPAGGENFMDAIGRESRTRPGMYTIRAEQDGFIFSRTIHIER